MKTTFLNNIFQIHNFEFDFDKLKEEIEDVTFNDTMDMVTNRNINLNFWTQYSLQTDSPDKKGIKYCQESVGKAKGEDWELSFKYPLFDAPIINSFMEHFKLHRTRIMIQEPRSVLTWHKDWTQRIHLPIYTHEHCKMVIEDNVYHLEEGKIYFTNTTKYHTAMNCHSTRRLHIVGCLPLNTRTWE